MKFVAGFITGIGFTIVVIYALVAYLSAYGWNGIQ